MSNQARGGETLPGGSPGPSSRARCTKPEQQQLTLGTWNVRTLLGKERKLVKDVERYKLDLVGLTSTHLRCISRPITLDRGWTLYSYGVARDVRRKAGVGILINPKLCATVLEFIPVDERVVSLRLRVMGGKSLTVVCVFAPTDIREYRAFLEILSKVLCEVPVEDFVVLLGDFNAQVGNETDKGPDVIGRHGLPQLNLKGTLLLKFCANRLSITNTMFEHEDPHTWYRFEKGTKNKIKHTSLIDFVIVPSSLRSHVLDTWVVKRTTLSTDHHLVLSQITEWGTLDKPGKPKQLLF